MSMILKNEDPTLLPVPPTNKTTVGVNLTDDFFLIDDLGVITTVGSGTIAITDDTTTNAVMYPTWVTAATGLLPIKVASTKLTFNPSTGLLSATTFTGVWDGTAISATKGGTAQTTYATGDTLYASAANTISKLAVGTVGQVLTLAGGVPTWATPAAGTVTSVSGTAARITSTGGATPVIDIAATYVGQTSITTLGTITTGVWNGTAIANANLANSTITVGTTAIVLGASSTTLGGLTTISMNNQLTNTLATGTAPLVISSTTRVSNLNVATAGTADVLTTARTINTVSFDGSGNIVVTAAAGTLTGATLAAGVTASSLTSVGTITTGVWTGTAVAAINGGTAQTTYTTGDILYASASNTLSKLAIGTAGQILTVLGGIPDWETNQASRTSAISISNTDTVVQSLTIGTGLQAGDSYEISAYGTCTSTVANLSTFTIRVGTAGSVADTSMGTVTCTAAASGTNIGFYFNALFTCRTTGAPGTGIANGGVQNAGVTGISAVTNAISGNTATGAITTASANIISLTYQSAAGTTTSSFRNVTISKM